LQEELIGIDWNFSQYIRDNVTESLSGVKGDNSVKIIGPDLDQLERLAEVVKTELEKIPGIKEVGIFHIKGQPNLEFPVDRRKCNQWGLNVADVQNVVQTAVGGKAFSSMVEGEKTFDITLRWPFQLRSDLQSILNIPVEVNSTVTPGYVPSVPQTTITGSATGFATPGYSGPLPSQTGSYWGGNYNPQNSVPRRRLGDLVTPLDSQGRPDPKGSFVRPGASTISREQGNRLIAVKFSVEKTRGLAKAVAEAQEKVNHVIPVPYRTEWSGEFQEMLEAEHRLLFFIPLSLTLIFILLYIAFHSILDVLLVLLNVVQLSVGGIWALWLTGTHFSVSAGVGFISVFGVAVMDGLLLVSYFNTLRSQGVPLQQAILTGAGLRVRPVMMTALTAVFGLLPAALSTKIGAQTQKPLAIVVVGAMITTLLLTRYLMPVVYSLYGNREPPVAGTKLVH
jgi:cobalt-zinc-cadmium resistance protein CzcA